MSTLGCNFYGSGTNSSGLSCDDSAVDHASHRDNYYIADTTKCWGAEINAAFNQNVDPTLNGEMCVCHVGNGWVRSKICADAWIEDQVRLGVFLGVLCPPCCCCCPSAVPNKQSGISHLIWMCFPPLSVLSLARSANSITRIMAKLPALEPATTSTRTLSTTDQK